MNKILSDQEYLLERKDEVTGYTPKKYDNESDVRY